MNRADVARAVACATACAVAAGGCACESRTGIYGEATTEDPTEGPIDIPDAPVDLPHDDGHDSWDSTSDWPDTPVDTWDVDTRDAAEDSFIDPPVDTAMDDTAGDTAETDDPGPYTCPAAAGEDIRLTYGFGVGTLPILSWTGSEYGMAWLDSIGEHGRVLFARLEPDGTMIGTGTAVTDSGVDHDLPALAWTGSEHVVAWSAPIDDDSDVYLARFSADGERVSEDVHVIDDERSSFSPVIAWTGSEIGIVWCEDRGNLEIILGRVGPDGSVIGGPVDVTNNASNDYFATLAWTGSLFGIAWFRGTGIQFKFVNPDGSPASGTRSTGGYNSSLMSMVWTGSLLGIAWDRTYPDPSRVAVLALDGAGDLVGTWAFVTDGSPPAKSPDIAWTGRGSGLVWAEDGPNPGEGTVGFVLMSAAGLGTEIRVSSPLAVAENPSMAWTGSEMGVAWSDARSGRKDIYFNRVVLCEP